MEGGGLGGGASLVGRGGPLQFNEESRDESATLAGGPFAEVSAGKVGVGSVGDVTGTGDRGGGGNPGTGQACGSSSGSAFFP